MCGGAAIAQCSAAAAGGAVRLAPAAEKLMVGEGIETVLAAMQATGMPGWAALSTSGLVGADPAADRAHVSSSPITTPTAPASGQRVPRRRGGSPRAAACASHYRPRPEPILPMCLPTAPIRQAPRCAVTPPNGPGAVRGIIATAREVTERDTWPEPDLRLVEDDRIPAPILEGDALPALWAEWIAAEAEARGCPRDYVAAALIGSASAWIGNARHAEATPTWREPPQLWFALIGAPSTGKTPALAPFVAVSRAIEREAEPAWKAASTEQAARAEAAGALDDKWRRAAKEAAEAGKPVPPRPAEADAPPPPPRPRLVTMNATTEELQYMLAHAPRGLLFQRDELAGWLGDHDRYGGHGGDRAFYLECWNGGAFVVDRVKHRGEPIRIARASLAILGGMQPDRLRQALAGPDDGLGARFAYIFPEPVPIAPLSREPDATARGRYERLLTAARRMSALAMDCSPGGEPEPRVLRLDSDAFALFDDIRHEAMMRARSTSGLPGGWHGKAGRALRLAIVFELLRQAATGGPEPCAIGADAMARAGNYLDYLGAMLDRVTAGLALSGAEADAAAILRNILATRPQRINERDLYQRPDWSWLRGSARRAAAFAELERHEIVRPATRASKGRPPGDWDVSPRLWERRP